MAAASAAMVMLGSGALSPSAAVAIDHPNPSIDKLTANDGPVVSTLQDGSGTVTKRYASGSTLVTSPMRYVPPPNQTGRNNTNQVSPNGNYYGDCGVSYVYLSSGDVDSTGRTVSGRGYHYSTGFYDTDIKLNSPTVDFVWHVKVIGPGWNMTDVDNGHPIYDYAWNGYNHWHTPNAGNYNSQVVQLSVAYLANGGACYSGGPQG